VVYIETGLEVCILFGGFALSSIGKIQKFYSSRHFGGRFRKYLATVAGGVI
jgi:hypothetical protein